METSKLKKFAQFARRGLIEQVSAKLKLVLAEGSAARREQPQAVAQIEKEIFGRSGSYTDNQQLTTDNLLHRQQLVERVAYTWFNRFCALRFMDVNRFTRIGVVSPARGQFQPEILAEAKAGHIDDGTMPDKTRQKIFALIDGSAPSSDPQGEAYRLLVVATCNDWNKAMPFLFEKIADFTELLMPDDLLSGNSILAYTREAMTPDACQDVEVIGWLYQFYISEKKDEVFDGLKKNKKITPENIPAATQLFTPHWIVRYLVENSLGRLWMLNRPNSKLTERMDYYIAPDNQQPSTDFLRVSSPEEIRICDPACGSGHMLTYAFDLLYAIYEEEGYESTEIPEKILTRNLYGIEIDERAGELAAFALTMKARAKQRRLFSKGIPPNICILQNIQFDEGELNGYMDEVGRDLFTAPLQTTLCQFEEADNFGSLIIPQATDVAEIKRLLDAKDMGGNLLLHTTHKKVLQALEMADFLSPKYHVVIANPPYMGGKGMNPKLANFAKKKYPIAKNDLYSMFMQRCLLLPYSGGYTAMIAMHSWMFLSRFEKLRSEIIQRNTIETLAHLGTRAFDSIGGEVVSTAAFVINTSVNPDFFATYLRLVDYPDSKTKSKALRDRNNIFKASSKELCTVPGIPLSYWLSPAFRTHFVDSKPLDSEVETAVGLFTCNNERFLRDWFEVSLSKIGFGYGTRPEASASGRSYFPIQKGGGYKRWYGLNNLIVQFGDDGQGIRDYRKDGGQSWSLPGEDYYFREGVTWSGLTTDANSFRWCDKGCIFESNKGQMLFSETPLRFLGYLNSVVCAKYIACINPTLSVQSNEIKRLPFVGLQKAGEAERVVKGLVGLGRKDWDSYETSWDFTSLPLLQPADYFQALEQKLPTLGKTDGEVSNHWNQSFQTLEKTYTALSNHWKTMTLEMQRLEKENNSIFIDAYGLQDELTPEVPLNEITLTCNPYYRYGKAPIESPHATSDFPLDTELEERLLADTMRELISYAVGCMFGRYSLDKPGLILANQGETLADYLKQIPQPSFPADDDNVIPMLDGDWFTDDISERFRKFLRVTFGEEHYEPNLRFIEEALGKDIQKYFLKDFYGDHVKRYKKRPIYWMFSSPKGSFNALIYMHRYRPDTVSVVLNDYLREFRTKLSSKLEHLRTLEVRADAPKGEKTKALKEIETIRKTLAELDEYERDTLYPLAGQQIEIDLDDGVKVNYPKFGAALKKIPGLEAKED